MEERIFIELLKMPDGRVSFAVGGGSTNNGQMEEHDKLTNALTDLAERATIDYIKMGGNFRDHTRTL